MEIQNLLNKLLFILNPVSLIASNDVNMALQSYVEERNLKIPQLKTSLSLIDIHTNTLTAYSLLLEYINFNLNYGNYKKVPTRK